MTVPFTPSPAAEDPRTFALGSRRLVPVLGGGAVHGRESGSLLLRLRLHEIRVEGCTVEQAASRFADHVERQGAIGQFLAYCYVDAGQPWTPEGAVDLATHLDSLTSPDQRTLRRGALEYAFLALAQSESLRLLGILRQLDVIRRDLDEPEQENGA